MTASREQECLRSLDWRRKSKSEIHPKSETFPLISLNRKKIRRFWKKIPNLYVWTRTHFAEYSIYLSQRQSSGCYYFSLHEFFLESDFPLLFKVGSIFRGNKHIVSLFTTFVWPILVYFAEKQVNSIVNSTAKLSDKEYDGKSACAVRYDSTLTQSYLKLMPRNLKELKLEFIQ